MTLTFHQAPKFVERLTATAREIHTGRRLSTCLIETKDANGALVAFLALDNTTKKPAT